MKVMKFYCTAGRGTEIFLEKELKDTFQNSVDQIIVTDGKVFFELTKGHDEVKKILELKTIERAFTQVLFMKTSELGQRNLMQLIKRNLNDKTRWLNALDVFLCVRGLLAKGDNLEDMVHECRSNCETEDEPVCKRPKLVTYDRSEDVTFRVNFKCPACFRKRLNIKSVPKQIGIHIKHLMGWNVELRHPLLEISVQLNDDYLTVGLPLTRDPLSKRSYIKHIGLRSTIAHIMVDLLQVQPGDTVLDPMCGKATILLEAAHCHKTARYVGVDKSEAQLHMAQENIHFAKCDNIHLIQGDAMALPLHDCSVNKIVTDAPFGSSHTTDIPLKDFYFRALQELTRVLSPSGKLVILTSSVMKNLILKITSAQSRVDKNVNMESLEKHEICSGDSDVTVEVKKLIQKDKEICENQICNEKEKVVINVTDEDTCSSCKDAKNEDVIKVAETGDSKPNHEFICDIQTDSRKDNKLQDEDRINPNGKCVSFQNRKTEAKVLHTESADLKNITDLKSSDKNKTVASRNTNDCFMIRSLILVNTYYVKLGETHAYICVLRKDGIM